MTDVQLLQLAHLLLFVYWLGGDLGVFYSSFFVTDARLSVPQRQIAAKILNGLDQGPRICMPLILAVGVHLAWRLGVLEAHGLLVAGVWALATAWLGMVLALHFGHGRAFVAPLTQVDFVFRVLVIAGLLTWAWLGTRGPDPSMAPWIALKLVVFAALVACGLLIRVRFKPFVPAFVRLVSDGATPELDAEIRATLNRVRPFVVTIWAGLVFNAAVGLHIVNL